jgi:hypothetical protein
VTDAMTLQEVQLGVNAKGADVNAVLLCPDRRR